MEGDCNNLKRKEPTKVFDLSCRVKIVTPLSKLRGPMAV